VKKLSRIALQHLGHVDASDCAIVVRHGFDRSAFALSVHRGARRIPRCRAQEALRLTLGWLAELWSAEGLWPTRQIVFSLVRRPDALADDHFTRLCGVVGPEVS
jgi:hypothetical protein